jgi:integrase
VKKRKDERGAEVALEGGWFQNLSSLLHCLRHTMATMADQAKLTMRERMDLLGHSDAKTTMGYTHADLQRVRAKLDEAENFVLERPLRIIQSSCNE